MSFDVLAIGDPVVDEFIRLKDARVNCDIRDEECMLCVRYGDKVPFEFSVAVSGVGNAPNASVACARLGLRSALRGYIGQDQKGDDCMQSWKENGVDTSLIVRDPEKKTNYHYVLWYETDRTILIKHEQFNYTWPDLAEPPKWIYLSSVGEGTLPYQQAIAAYVAAHPGVKLAFQPGTFQIKVGIEALKDLYTNTEILFCNKEEAQTILSSVGGSASGGKTTETDVKKLMEGIRALGPKISVITDGRKGSYAMNDDGAWRVPMYPDPKPPLERTGAGDAASATTVAYLIRGLPLHEALMRGLINSANVVQEIGAQKGLLTTEQIEDWYAKRPEDFKATAL